MADSDTLISVIIPSYNRAAVILKSIESVLSQSHARLELIVVDDGSADNTAQLLEGFPDSRLRCLRYEPNRGACHARNYGAERASGSLLAFQDSDDVWHPRKLELQLRFLEESGADLVFCGINRTAENGRRFHFPVNGFDNGGDAVRQFLMENRAGTQTLLMRREVWAKTRFDESFRRYQDWDFMLSAARSFRIAYLPQALVESAVGGDSISSRVSSYPALLHLFEKHEAAFRENPDCLARLYRRMGNRLRREDPSAAADCYKAGYALEARASDYLKYALCASAARRGTGKK